MNGLPCCNGEWGRMSLQEKGRKLDAKYSYDIIRGMGMRLKKKGERALMQKLL